MERRRRGERRSIFVSTFSKKETPTEIPEFRPKERDILSVLVDSGLSTSRSDARRVLEQGGVTINGEVVSDIRSEVPEGAVLQEGKINFLRII